MLLLCRHRLLPPVIAKRMGRHISRVSHGLEKRTMRMLDQGGEGESAN
jgi:hypothetical protein